MKRLGIHNPLPWTLRLAVVLFVLGAASSTSQSLVPHPDRAAAMGTHALDVAQRLDTVLGRVFEDYAAEIPRGAPTGSTAAAYDWLGDGGRVIKCRMVTARRSCALWETLQDLEKRAANAGAKLLWAQRLQPDGQDFAGTAPAEERDVLRVDLGTPGVATHTLLVRDPAAPPPAVCWEDVPLPVSAEELLGSADQPTVAIVVDDWGYGETPSSRGMLELDIPLTLAILPGLPHSRETALLRTDLALPDPGRSQDADASSADLRRDLGCPVELRVGRLLPDAVPSARRETMLHLPMEPEDYPRIRPGRNAVMTTTPGAEVARIVETAVSNLPGITGVNNHMGSAATADSRVMGHVMGALAPTGLFYLDSRTSPRSTAYRTARRHGLTAVENTLFLDDKDPTRAEVRANLERCLELAETQGTVVAICHPYAPTLAVLHQEIPRLRAAGVRFVTVSEMLALERRDLLAMD